MKRAWSVFMYGSLVEGAQQSCPTDEATARAEAAGCNRYATPGVRYEARELTSEVTGQR